MTSKNGEPEWKLRLNEALRHDGATTGELLITNVRRLPENITLASDPWNKVYSLATVESDFGLVAQDSDIQTINDSFSPVAKTVIPRVRNVVHRSFLSLGESKQRSGAVILQTTTDVRSAKGSQIHREGGNSAEVAWWFPGCRLQFRLQCFAYLLPASTHPWRPDFPIHLSGEEGRDWEAERLKAFNALSAPIRASFVRPTPGSELKHPDEANRWPVGLPKAGEEENEQTSELVKQALQNFAILYLDVQAVDLVDLGGPPDKRFLFRKEGNGWSKTVLVP